MNILSIMREDVRVFRMVYPKKGLLKYFYYPGLRTVLLFRLSQWFFQYRLLRPLAYLLTLLNDLIAGSRMGPQVSVGSGLFLGHARGVVVNPTAKIGKCCSIMNE